MTEAFIRLEGCPVCGRKDRLFLFEIKKCRIFECAECRFRYLDPCFSSDTMEAVYESDESLVQHHDFHKNYYDYGDLNKASKTRTDFLRAITMLERHLPQGARTILDVGYGNGFFLALAQKRGWNVDGIDPSSDNKEKAREKFDLKLRAGSWGKMLSEEKKYNVITLWDVLEHLPDPHGIIRNLSGMLAPDGMILVAVPNDRSFLRLFSSFLYKITWGWFRVGVEKCYLLEHTGYYRKDSLRLLFHKNGFEMLDFFYSSTDLNRYKFSFTEKMLACMVLVCGRLLNRENRLIALFQKKKSAAGCRDIDCLGGCK